jgi:ubiquinone/menaquinone biosynthesis C-methylase UbiE
MSEPSSDILDYYQRRAPYYDRMYARTAGDVATLRRRLPELFAGLDVLELAAGTGFWTPAIAGTANRVLATDANPGPLELARRRDYPGGNVDFALADAYALDAVPGTFTAAFAGFWWSHVRRTERDPFLAGLARRLEPGALVVMVDSFFVEGHNSPPSRTDADGDTYQTRQLDDGRRYEIVKNFCTRDELLDDAGRHGTDPRVELLDNFWVLSFRTVHPTRPSPGAAAAG